MTSRSKPRGARAVADVSAGTILATVEIAAPGERVFRALTDPQEIARWWGSAETAPTTSWTSDLRRGGSVEARGLGADDQAIAGEGEYLVVEPAKKLVHTWKAASDDGQTTTVSYSLESIAEGTRVTLRHDGFAGRPESCRAHSDGWELALGRLAGFAAPAQSEAPSYFMFKLLPPRATFPGDMTEREHQVMGEHLTYWADLMQRGIAVVFGPVFDPGGPWGAAVVAARDEHEVHELHANDPLTRANLGFVYEVHPMPGAVVRP